MNLSPYTPSPPPPQVDLDDTCVLRVFLLCNQWHCVTTTIASSDEGVMEKRYLRFRVLGASAPLEPSGHSTRRPKVGYQDELPRATAHNRLPYTTASLPHTRCSGLFPLRRGARSHAEVSLRRWRPALSLQHRPIMASSFSAPVSNF